MASSSITAPMRGAALQLSRLALRRAALPYSLTTLAFARPLSTTTTTTTNTTPLTTNASPAQTQALVTPFEDQTVLATIHRFPSLEPLRLEVFPANHLYLPTRRDILHRAVVYEGDMTRLGTASTKSRHEVHGSARKIRPQKGSGKARLGDKKSPMLRGGGVAFGPRPRDFSTELQKKVYDLAWRTALSYRFRKGELIIVDNPMEIESPSTRLLSHIFKYHEKQRGKGRSVMVTLEERPMLEQALEEMDCGDQALLWDEVDVKNLLEGSRVLIERAALNNILLSHQEDLTHKAVHQPWHKSFVRSSSPEELESIIGWTEFRGLMLTEPEDKDAARADAYESVASTRYAHAETLPQGPNRTELTISAYNLLAEAKRLQFAQKTGLPFADYVLHQARETAASLFPRVQAIEYQIGVKTQLGNTAEETSRLTASEHYLEVMQLEVQKAEILHEAALLAAQVHEHVAEAHVLVGEETQAEECLTQASDERTNVDAAELDLLTARLEVAKQDYQVQALRGNTADQKRAEKQIKVCTGLLEAKHAEAEAFETQMSEVPEAEVQPVVEVTKSS